MHTESTCFGVCKSCTLKKVYYIQRTHFLLDSLPSHKSAQCINIHIRFAGCVCAEHFFFFFFSNVFVVVVIRWRLCVFTCTFFLWHSLQILFFFVEWVLVSCRILMYKYYKCPAVWHTFSTSDTCDTYGSHFFLYYYYYFDVGPHLIACLFIGNPKRSTLNNNA